MPPNAQAPRSAPSPPSGRSSGTGTGTGNTCGYTARVRTPPPPISSRTGTGSGSTSSYTSRIRTPPLSPTRFNHINLENDGNDEHEEDIESNNDADMADPATAAPSSHDRPRAAQQPRQRRQRPRPLRSAGGSRAIPIVNPVLGTEIIVGTWRQSTNPFRPNAVIARFDRNGRLNYRVVGRTMNNEVLPAPTGTSTSLPSINLRSPYVGLSADEIRILLDRHMRMSPERRP